MDPMMITRMAADYTAAWNSKNADAVASFYAENGGIVINRGTPWEGRSGVRDMAAGIFADVPALALSCDAVRVSGTNVLILRTFVGHAAEPGAPLKIHGWEEWDLNADMKVQASRGWFDADAYARQAAG